MTNRRTFAVSIIFIVCDALLVYGIYHIAFILRNAMTSWFPLLPVFWSAVDPVLQLSLFFIIGIFSVQRLYPGYGFSAVKELEIIGKSVMLAFFLLTCISYLYKPFQEFPRSIIFISWIISFIVFPPLHFLIRNLLSRFKWYGIPAYIFGEDPWREELIASLNKVRRLGWRPEYIHALNNLPQLETDDRRLPLAIIGLNESAPIEGSYRILNKNFRKVVMIRQSDRLGSLCVEPRDVDGKLGLEFRYNLLRTESNFIKWMIDRFGSLVIMVVISPILIIIALLIILDSKGGIFFRQERVGKDFRQFQVLKFRTMVEDAEKKLELLLDENQKIKKEYAEFHKITDDPRITRIGKLLRKFSLDELPQLWNVLTGSMSLVGPRAYMVTELEDMGTYAPIILRAKPGMTGWWQVMEKQPSLFSKRLQMDEFYISNWSLWLDVYILLKTVIVVFKGQGR